MSESTPTGPAASSSGASCGSAAVTAFRAPEVNVRIGPFIVDFLWRDRRLDRRDGRLRAATVVASAFEDDRARDAELKLLGYKVVRFTYRQVVDEPAAWRARPRLCLAVSWRVLAAMRQ